MKAQFYGYRATFIAVLVVIYSTMSVGIFAVIVPSAVERFGGSYTAVGTAGTIETLFTFIGAAFAGRIYARFGYRPVFAAAALSSVAFLLTYGFATNIAVLYLVEAVFGFLFGVAVFNALSTFIATWFIERRDRVIGIGLGMASLGAALGSTLTTALIAAAGEANAIYILLALAVPVLVLVYFVKTPAQLNQEPLGADKQDVNVEVIRDAGKNVDKQAVRRSILSLPFMLMFVSSLILGSILFSTLYISPIMASQGIPELTSMALVTVALLSYSASSVLLGMIAQKAGSVAYAVVGFGMALGGLVLWPVIGPNEVGAIVVAVLVGSGAGFNLTYSATLVSHVFELDVYARIVPVLAGAASIGFALVSIVFPALAESTGSWFIVQIVVMIIVAVAAILTFVALGAARRVPGTSHVAAAEPLSAAAES